MPIEFKEGRALFQDVVTVEEAEALLEQLQKVPGMRIDFSACSHLHTANLQVLMAARPEVVVWPEDLKLREWLEPTLKLAS